MYRLFVYGSLLPGERDHALLAGAEFHGPVRTLPKYSLFDLQVYPALVKDGTTEVTGELYSVDATTRSRLDVCKECPILFQRARVELVNGDQAEAYFMRLDQVRGRRKVWNGDWRNRFALRPKPGADGPMVRWAKGRFGSR
jgi:gamma-glutamylcyclotransferase (GGCT)/AIG2-like uncharacterized protein YtfP